MRAVAFCCCRLVTQRGLGGLRGIDVPPLSLSLSFSDSLSLSLYVLFFSLGVYLPGGTRLCLLGPSFQGFTFSNLMRFLFHDHQVSLFSNFSQVLKNHCQNCDLVFIVIVSRIPPGRVERDDLSIVFKINP